MLGWFLVVIGIFLALMMGGLTILIAGLAHNSGAPGAPANFKGAQSQVAIIFGVFGVIFAIGMTSVIGGIYQIKYGKRNKKIQIMTFVLVGLVILSYFVVNAFIPHS